MLAVSKQSASEGIARVGAELRKAGTVIAVIAAVAGAALVLALAALAIGLSCKLAPPKAAAA